MSSIDPAAFLKLVAHFGTDKTRNILANQSFYLQPFPGQTMGYVKNPDGSYSNERKVTFESDGKFYVAPTLIFDATNKGLQLTPQQAVERAHKIGFHNFPSFDTQDQAEEYQKIRSFLSDVILNTGPK